MLASTRSRGTLGGGAFDRRIGSAIVVIAMAVMSAAPVIAAERRAGESPDRARVERAARADDSGRSRAAEAARPRGAEQAQSQAQAQAAAEASRRQAGDQARQQAASQAQRDAAARRDVEQAQARAAAEASRRQATDQARQRAAEQAQRQATEAAQQRQRIEQERGVAAAAARRSAESSGRDRSVDRIDTDSRARIGFGDRDDRDRSRPAGSTTTVVNRDQSAIHNDHTPRHTDHDALQAAARGQRQPSPQPVRIPDRRGDHDDRHDDHDRGGKGGYHGNHDRDNHNQKHKHKDDDCDDGKTRFWFGLSIGSGYGFDRFHCVHGSYYSSCGFCSHRYRCTHGLYYSACSSCCDTHYPVSYHTVYGHVYQPNTAVIVAAPQPVVVEQRTVVEQVVEPEPLPDPALQLPDGWSLIRAKAPAEARRAFEKLIEHNPNDGLHRIGYAIASALLEDDDAAALAMRDAVATDPASMITLPRDHVVQLYLRSLIGRYQVRAETDAAHGDDAFMVAALAYLDQQFALASASVRLAIADGDEAETTTQLRDMIRYQLNYQRDAAKPTAPGAPTE